MKTGQRPPARDDVDEMVAGERAGFIAFYLGRGYRLTNHDVQVLTGLNASGAWMMMGKLSRVLPLTFSGYGGTWQAMDVADGADGFEANPPQR